MKKNSKKMSKMITGVVLTASLLVPLVPQSAHAEVNKSMIASFGGSGYDKFKSVTPTPDGGYIAVGESRSNDKDMAGISKGFLDSTVVKFDSSGKKVWSKSYGGTQADSFASIVPTPDGGYLTVGYSNGIDGDFSKGSHGNNDAVVIKLDANGNKVWTKSFGGSASDQFDKVILTSDGGFVVVGRSESNDQDMQGLSKGQADAIIVKYDANGTKLWSKVFGGSQTDNFYSVAPTADGGVIAVGTSSSHDGDTTKMNLPYIPNGVSYAIALKYDSKGNQVFAKPYLGLSSNYPIFRDIVPSTDGGFLVAGFVNVGYGSNKGYIAKLDANGQYLWEKTFGGTNSTSFYSVTPTSDGGCIAVGESFSSDGDMKGLKKGYEDAVAVRYDANGNKLETTVLNVTNSGSSSFYSIAKGNDGGFVVVGESDSTNGDLAGMNKGGQDAILVKYADGVSLQTLIQNATTALNQAKKDLSQSSLDNAVKAINLISDTYAGKQDLLKQAKSIQAQIDVNTLTAKIGQADLTNLDIINQLQTQLDTTTTSVNQNVTDTTLKANLVQQLATLQEKLNEAKATILTGQAETNLTTDSVALAQSAIDTVNDTSVKDALQTRINVVKQVLQATDDVNKLKDSLTSFETTLNQTDLAKATDVKLNILDKIKNVLKGNASTTPSVMDNLQSSLKDIQTQEVVVENEVTSLPDSTVATISQRKTDLTTQVTNVQQVSNVIKAILDANSKGGHEEHGDLNSALSFENEHNEKAKTSVNYLIARQMIHLSANANLYDVAIPVFPSKEEKANVENSALASKGNPIEKNHFANDGVSLQPKSVTLGSILTDKLGGKEDIHFLSVNHSLATMDDQGNTALQYKTLTVHGKEVKVLDQGMDNLIAYSSKGYIDVYALISQAHLESNEK
ncbi:hypothetical protein PP175_26225 (plasmid) [Aneurinibacillus sp. Ricciae_BoGa-3]|uniref:hypothetical protein n=1 Tax=Aneurinibacillus sp. Ricciae_BoGa-3 TaxID=3022697 RepID=UPI0023416C72|nr:hypothetical protein [Aneurinibacillus sp. Ricciae_BoGa-3]WCK57565.1 hypothetical protein PP175_26225 [Aneurinibacillus sp. Ricciae_BoGa-3]